jgi:hypothetical protein
MAVCGSLAGFASATAGGEEACGWGGANSGLGSGGGWAPPVGMRAGAGALAAAVRVVGR